MLRVLDDDEAEVEIESYLIPKKGCINQIDLLDLISYLNLPGEQIERIMDNYKIKGLKLLTMKSIKIPIIEVRYTFLLFEQN